MKDERLPNKLLLNFLKKNLTIFNLYIFLVIIFLSLDYFTYTSDFHLSKSSFIENYLYNIDILSSGFLLIFVILPIGIVLFIFLIIYTMIYLIVFNKDGIITDKKSKKNTFIIEIFFFLLIIAIFTVINIISSYVVTNILFYFCFNSIVQALLIILINIKYKIFHSHYLCFLIIYFMYFMFSALFMPYFTNFFSSFITNYHYPYFYVTISSFVFLLSMFIGYLVFRIKNNKLGKKDKIAFFSIFLIILPFVFYAINHYGSWNYTNTSSFNLILNNTYRSQNHRYINVNINNYKNSDTSISKCKPKHGVKVISISTDKNTTYIPLLKNKKIYFVKKDSNTTCVYIVEKQNNNFVLNDIGYLEN